MFANYSLAEQQVNAKGGRYCPLSDADNKPAWLLPAGKLICPFGGPSCYESLGLHVTTGRLNLDLRCDEELEQTLTQFDQWFLTHFTPERADKLCKKKLTSEQIKDAYKPTLQKKGDYPSHVRCKINVGGQAACRFWTPDGRERNPPDDWRAVELKARLLVRSMWIMNGHKDMGFTIQVCDVQVFPRSRACPFKRCLEDDRDFADELASALDEA